MKLCPLFSKKSPFPTHFYIYLISQYYQMATTKCKEIWEGKCFSSWSAMLEECNGEKQIVCGFLWLKEHRHLIDSSSGRLNDSDYISCLLLCNKLLKR